MGEDLDAWMKWMRENGRREFVDPVGAGCLRLDPPCPNCEGLWAHPPEQQQHKKPCGYCVLCCERGRCEEDP